jgi:hypothetical protein
MLTGKEEEIMHKVPVAAYAALDALNDGEAKAVRV